MRIGFCVFALLLISIGGFAGTPKSAPSWVDEARSVALPQYEGTVPAAVLLEEQHVTVSDTGMLVTQIRKAVKILNRTGQSSAEAFLPYYRGGIRVKSLRAWLIAPNGFVKAYDKSSIVDLGAYDGMELYNDLRFARIKAENPEVGSVFAYESELEENMLFAQDEYLFQSDLPAINSRYVLDLPAGWTAKGIVLNHAPVEPLVSGSTYTWKLTNLSFRKHEEYSPELLGSGPVLAVSFFSGSAGADGNRNCFRSWTDVSRWHTNLAAEQADVSPELTNQVQQLIGGEKDELDRIRAIAQYVQKIKYVAIEMDEAHGGGYKPHLATLVFRKQYGDCKDKANLMRSMLKAAGIDSYLVAIYSGDRTHVHPEWPSPTQFNHMIIAVHVSEGIKVPTAIEAPMLGEKVLIFDPTSEITPLGDMPWYEQGSFALVMAGEKGGMLQMPVLSPEANETDVQISGELSGSGALKADYALMEAGQYADHERALKLYRATTEYRQHLESLFSEGMKSANISGIAYDDTSGGRSYNIKAHLESDAYGQKMGGGLLVIGASFMTPFGPTFPVTSSREEAIVLRAGLHRKHIRLKLPEGYKVDELPSPLDEKTPWGQFSVNYKQEQGTLLVEEAVRTEAVTLPPDQYNQVKKFFDDAYGADAQQAVLTKE